MKFLLPICILQIDLTLDFQIVIGSFYAGSHQDQNVKKVFIPSALAPIPVSSPQTEDFQGQQNSAATIQNIAATSLGGNNWFAYADESRNKPTDINVTLPLPS